MSNPREVTVGSSRFRRVLTGDGLTRRWELYCQDDASWIPYDECQSGLFLDALLAMQTERDEARELVFEMFRQDCLDCLTDEDTYDHGYISATKTRRPRLSSGA